jgi:hypothetical protein
MKFLDKYRQNALNKKLIESYDGKISDIQILLDNGADIHVIDEAGNNLLDLATKERNIAFFLDQGLSFLNQTLLNKTLMFCIESPETFSRLIALGANVNFRTANIAPVILLIDEIKNSNDVKILNILLANNVEVNTQGLVTGKTALHFCIGAQNINLVKMLIDHGARTDIMNNDGETAVDLAKRLFRETNKSIYQDILTVLNTEDPLPKVEPVTAKETISFVHEEPELGLRITKIFNFVSGTCDVIVYNEKAKMQSNTLVSLSALEDTNLLLHAEAEFVKQGGVPKYSLKKHLDKL